MRKRRRPTDPSELHCYQCGREQNSFTYHCWYCLAPLTDKDGVYLDEALKPVILAEPCLCGEGDCIECYPAGE